jgi:hypothetical protein
MNLDDRARMATDGLLAAARDDVRVPVALDRLHHGRTSPARAGLAAVAVVAVVVAGFGGLRWSTEHVRGSSPAVVAPSPSTRVALAVPFSVVLPVGWSRQVYGNARAVLYGPDGSYLEIVMDPSPATAASATTQKLTAESFARWIAARPDLWAASPVRTTVAGQPAWQVDLLFGPDARPNATCDGPNVDCLPLIRVPGVTLPLGLANGTAGRATVIQLGNGRLITMTAGGDSQHHLEEVVASVQPVLDSITFDHS